MTHPGLRPDKVCPHCQAELELDCLVRPGNQLEFLWQPCCQVARDQVESLGWFSLYDESFEASCARELGIVPPGTCEYRETPR